MYMFSTISFSGIPLKQKPPTLSYKTTNSLPKDFFILFLTVDGCLTFVVTLTAVSRDEGEFFKTVIVPFI